MPPRPCPATPGDCPACSRRVRWADIQACRHGQPASIAPARSCSDCAHRGQPLLAANGRQVGHATWRFTTVEDIDYAVSTLQDRVAKLRELSPLWEMFKDGVDLSTIQWAAH